MNKPSRLRKRPEYLLFYESEYNSYAKVEDVPQGFFREPVDFYAKVVNYSSLDPVKEIKMKIRPLAFPQLTPFTKELTGLTQDDINNGVPFDQFIRELEGVIDEFSPLVSTWSKDDKEILMKACMKHHLTYPFGPFYEQMDLAHEFKLFKRLERHVGLNRAIKIIKGPLIPGHSPIEDVQKLMYIFDYMKSGYWQPTVSKKWKKE